MSLTVRKISAKDIKSQQMFLHECFRNRNDSSFEVWDDGFSPIVFCTFYKQQGVSSSEISEFKRQLTSLARRINSKFKGSYAIINLSLVRYTTEQLVLVKEIRKIFDHSLIQAIAIVNFNGMNFKVNMEGVYVSKPNQKMKCFDHFEDALAFINKKMLETNEHHFGREF